MTLADTVPNTSLDASSLRALLTEWTTLNGQSPTTDRDASIKALAHKLVAHRARLFAANAKLQADAPSDDDAATIGQMDANQLGIKACTNALTEMVAVLGHASIPA